MTFTIPLSICLVIFAVPVIWALCERYWGSLMRKAYMREMEKHIETLKKFEIGQRQYDELFNTFKKGEAFSVTLRDRSGVDIVQYWKPAGKQEEWPEIL